MKILLTLNGTEKSESIIPFVAELARRRQAEVLLTRVLDPVAAIDDPLVPVISQSFHDEMMHSVDEYLKNMAKRFAGLPVRTFSLVGPPGECIRKLAVEEQCDLLIMASRGHTGFVRWFWGSVAEGMARVAPCPVLLVRRPNPGQFQQVLVPIDGSEPSWKVVDQLSRLVDPAATRVTVLHCTGITEVEEMESEAARERAYAQRCELKNLADGRPWIHLEFTSASAPEGIFSWLADHPCDLVAMSTRGRQGLAHLWSGSVTEQVARSANCPVLVFPPALVKV